MPPLRTQTDIDALMQGLQDDTIDVICSDHTPQDTESKVKEFDIAEFGMIGLETFYGVLCKALGNKISIEKLVEKIAINPRKIFDIEVPKIALNHKANLTVFSPSQSWKYELDHGLSKSKNSPFDGCEFKGKVLRTILNK
jgi:dihydroorotase